MRRLVFAAALLAADCASGSGASLTPVSEVAAPGRDAVTLPLKDGSLRFAVVGDTGTAARIQIDLARQMAAWHERVGFEFVVMTGQFEGTGPIAPGLVMLFLAIGILANAWILYAALAWWSRRG